MGILEKFNQNSKSANNVADEVIADADGKLAGLNLIEEMKAHTAWKGKLQEILQQDSCEGLDVVVASADGHCSLGRWIHGKGKSFYGHLPEYEALRAAHANLHACAGEVLTQHILGNQNEAEHLLKSKFRLAYNRNKFALVSFFGTVKR